MTRPRQSLRESPRRTSAPRHADIEPAARRDVTGDGFSARARADIRRDIPLERDADGPAPRQAAHVEVAIHELADGLAQALISAQRELDRYGNTLGAYLLEELDFTVPVRMRLDSLGQVMTSLVDQPVKDAPVAQLRLRVRAAIGTESPPDVTSPQALDELGVFDAAALELLSSFRVFSVDDLLRVARGAAGRRALSRIDLGRPLKDILDQLSVAAIPVITPFARRALVQAGVKSASDLVDREPAALAKLVSKVAGRTVAESEVADWQKQVSSYLGISVAVRPSRPGRHIHG